MPHQRRGLRALAVVLVVMLLSACAGPRPDRARDTAAEARRDRIAAARAASPIGVVGDDELDLLDAFLQWRAEWDAAAAAVFAALDERRRGDVGAPVGPALDELADEAADLAALERRGVDATVAGWVDEIGAGYGRQVDAVAALARAEVDGTGLEAAQAEVRRAYGDTVAVELRLLREVAEWVNEDGPATRRLTEIADAIERETAGRAPSAER